MLTTAEAYEAASAPYIVGASIIAHALVDQVAATAHTPELAHAVDFARKSVHVADGKRREALARVQALVGTASDPDTSTFDSWLRETRAAVEARVSGIAARAAELGALVGELYLATWTARTLIYLRTAEPSNAVTARQASAIDKRVGELRAALVGALSHPELHAVAEPGDKLLTLVALPRAAAAATTVADYKAYFEWAVQIWNLVPAFGAMLA